MEFDALVVKESPGLCRCCLSEGCYKDLGTEYTWMNDTEVYADMLFECFDISITQHNDGPNGPNRLICEVCITRLRDACNFKKQVLNTEKKFIDMIGRREFKPQMLIYQAQVKNENQVGVIPDGEEVEYLEDDVQFGDDDPKESTDVEEPSMSEDITVSSLPVKGKRGRPRKNAKAKTEKAKVARVEEKKPVKVKGVTRARRGSVEQMSSTKRNRLMKRNAMTLLETTTVVPFKWQRQNYLCFYCHLSFKCTDLLKQHTTNEHKTSNVKSAVSYLRRDEKVKIDVTTLKCTLCHQEFNELNKMADHVKMAHGKLFNEECGYGVIPYKLNKNDFQCAVCKESFEYFIKLNQHMNEHYGCYMCELCGKSFLSQDRLRCHALSHRSGYKCNICSDTFDTLTQKNNHESKVHNKNKSVKCFYCTESFPNYTQRKTHLSAVHNISTPEHKCPVCGKTFLIMSKMRVHLKEVHIREKNFACTMCDQRFFSKTHVHKHMVKHFGDRVHQCEACNKSYARKQTLRDHMRIHNNDKRFVCSVCSQAFVQNNSLRLHLRVHHPEIGN